MEIKLVKDILAANEVIAAQNKAFFTEHGVYVVNLMGSPGAGKTTLLERTIEGLKVRRKMAVIEGDIATSRDAERIAAHAIQAVQINTGGECHLDGNMVRGGLGELDLDGIELLVVENVGNLVCPAEFKLGEGLRAMILSVAEGHDKPLKYPLMFSDSQVLVVNKTDLIGLGDFDMEELHKAVKGMNPEIVILELSCRTGDGLEAWTDWLYEKVQGA
jgi:hydrogenase nickel incorporation protein HypB